jgi:hypothetical protein
MRPRAQVRLLPRPKDAASATTIRHWLAPDGELLLASAAVTRKQIEAWLEANPRPQPPSPPAGSDTLAQILRRLAELEARLPRLVPYLPGGAPPESEEA